MDSFDRIATVPPRAFELADREAKSRLPVGQRKVARAKVDQQLAPLVTQAANGQVPWDANLEEVAARQMRRMFKKIAGGKNG